MASLITVVFVRYWRCLRRAKPNPDSPAANRTIGATHFLTKTLDHVSTEMSLHELAYNMKRVIELIGTKRLLEAI